MTRAPELNLDDMSDEQKRVYEEIVSGPRGAVRGPLSVWLTRPGLADQAQSLGRYARFDTLLPPRLSELAIITTARIWGSAYEWFAHSGIALEAGIDEEFVEALRQGKIPKFDDSQQKVVFEFAVTLHVKRRVLDDQFNHVVDQIGKDAVVDLVGILGYYTLISMTLNVFEVQKTDTDGADPIRFLPELGKDDLVFGHRFL
ncbi:MAG: carboxymuconolactone decarboxylase family protein [Rhodospirillales bacterium]